MAVKTSMCNVYLHRHHKHYCHPVTKLQYTVTVYEIKSFKLAQLDHVALLKNYKKQHDIKQY